MEVVADWKSIFAVAENSGAVEHYLVEHEGSRFSELETAKKAWRRSRRSAHGEPERHLQELTVASE